MQKEDGTPGAQGELEGGIRVRLDIERSTIYHSVSAMRA
jgi:hypothetical protein